jgi:hypothetical protein
MNQSNGQFRHGDRVKRRTHVPELYIYGVYLGTIQDFDGRPICICFNPDVTYSYFFSRPDDLFPLDKVPTEKRQPPLITSKY